MLHSYICRYRDSRQSSVLNIQLLHWKKLFSQTFSLQKCLNSWIILCCQCWKLAWSGKNRKAFKRCEIRWASSTQKAFITKETNVWRSGTFRCDTGARQRKKPLFISLDCGCQHPGDTASPAPAPVRPQQRQAPVPHSPDPPQAQIPAPRVCLELGLGLP